MASNIVFDFKELQPEIDTIRNFAYKTDYNFDQILSALNLFSYRGVEIGPNEPEDLDCLWIDTNDETVEETAQNITIIEELMNALQDIQARVTAIEQQLAPPPDDGSGDEDTGETE